MDKILLTAFLSALAGFITAVISIVKLVNEKESKTTDYRQAWTDSIRKAFADLIANINSQASRLIAAAGVRDELNRMHADDDDENAQSKRVRDHQDKVLADHRMALHDTKKAIYESYALVRLHFKPNDLSFNRIEQKFDVLEGLLTDLSRENEDVERATIREKIHTGANEIAGYARDILKTEWETVKRGEPAYQLTKKWSIGSSIAMFVILLSIGIHAGITIWKANIAADHAYKSTIELPSPAPSRL
ncbi:hypothetical protein [Pseudomonas sp. BF-B-26]|jgi:hypothetical protein|uniref:hypothetical protein n=1 Tax=Pseudomonas sp. BF-B-26 TaxID=2832400 RepID=UPI001CBFDBD2|nr:hypothetical protein [Pseudomonas sp. BF-B-26]